VLTLILKYARQHSDSPKGAKRKRRAKSVDYTDSKRKEDPLANAAKVVNQQTSTGSTPLLISAELGHTEVAALLLQHRADANQPDEYGMTALYQASANGHAEIARMLLEAGAVLDSSCQFVADMEGHNELIELFTGWNSRKEKEQQQQQQQQQQQEEQEQEQKEVVQQQQQQQLFEEEYVEQQGQIAQEQDREEERGETVKSKAEACTAVQLKQHNSDKDGADTVRFNPSNNLTTSNPTTPTRTQPARTRRADRTNRSFNQTEQVPEAMAQAMAEADAVAGADAEDDPEAVVEQAKPAKIEIDEEMLKDFSLPLFDDDSDSRNEDTNMEGGADSDAGSVESEENAGGFRMSIELDEDMLKDFSLPLLDEEEGMEEGADEGDEGEDELSHLSLAGESGTSTRAPINIPSRRPASTGGLATEDEGWAMNDDGGPHVARSESLPELQALDDGLGAGAMSMPSPTTMLMMGMPLSSPTDMGGRPSLVQVHRRRSPQSLVLGPTSPPMMSMLDDISKGMGTGRSPRGMRPRFNTADDEELASMGGWGHQRDGSRSNAFTMLPPPVLPSVRNGSRTSGSRTSGEGGSSSSSSSISSGSGVDCSDSRHIRWRRHHSTDESESSHDMSHGLRALQAMSLDEITPEYTSPISTPKRDGSQLVVSPIKLIVRASLLMDGTSKPAEVVVDDSTAALHQRLTTQRRNRSATFDVLDEAELLGGTSGNFKTGLNNSPSSSPMASPRSPRMMPSSPLSPKFGSLGQPSPPNSPTRGRSSSAYTAGYYYDSATREQSQSSQDSMPGSPGRSRSSSTYSVEGRSTRSNSSVSSEGRARSNSNYTNISSTSFSASVVQARARVAARSRQRYWRKHGGRRGGKYAQEHRHSNSRSSDQRQQATWAQMVANTPWWMRGKNFFHKTSIPASVPTSVPRRMYPGEKHPTALGMLVAEREARGSPGRSRSHSSLRESSPLEGKRLDQSARGAGDETKAPAKVAAKEPEKLEKRSPYMHVRKLRRDPLTGVLLWPSSSANSSSNTAVGPAGGAIAGEARTPSSRGLVRKLVWLEGELVWHYRDRENTMSSR
jgi:hypothetical protein